MIVTTNVYGNLFDQAAQGNFNWVSHPVKLALLNDAYVPNFVAHVHWSDVSANEISGTGYTAGGMTLTTKSHSVLAANSWGNAWAASTSYATGTIVRPSAGNGYVYRATTGGISLGSEPTWPTVVGQNLVDGTVVWSCVGQQVAQWSSDPVTWSTATFVARYGVLYDTTSNVLICLIDLLADRSCNGSNFTLTPVIGGWFVNVS